MGNQNNPSTILGEALLGAIREAARGEIQAVLSQNGFEGKKSLEVANPYLTVREAANLSRLGQSTIRLVIRKGELKAHPVGRRVIIKRTDLEKFLEAHSTEVLPG